MMRNLAAIPCLALACSAAAPARAETLEFPPFGAVAVYRPSTPIERVALFVSGDGGWNQGVVDMARELQEMGWLVAGVDIRKYLARLESSKSACAYPAGDFEALGQYVQKKLALPQFIRPILVGYSSGATLVYAVLAQAPSGTFGGAVSLGFCPDLEIVKPPCKGSGLTVRPRPKGKGFLLDAKASLAEPWRVLQGEIDQVCAPQATESFVAAIPTAKLYRLPKVGHGYSVPRNWLPQFREAAREVAERNVQEARPGPPPAGAREVPSVDDLPLITVPATGTPRDALAVILTGDGGWSGLDKEVAGALSERGVACIGWNSLKYYWTQRTPESAAGDLVRILRYSLAGLGDARIMLVGYSLGADVLSFLVARLPEDLKSRIASVTLIAPSTSVAFEFHLSNWLGGNQPDALPTLPEAKKLAGMKLLCLYGSEEKESLCGVLPPGLAEVESLPGGHHFGGDYEAVAARILKTAGL